MEDDDFDIKILKNPESKKFKEFLEKAPYQLTKTKARSFYRTVLNLFDKDYENAEIGELILQTIVKTINTEIFLKEFVEGKFVNYLPYSKAIHHRTIFDILYFVISYDNTVIDSNFVGEFRDLIQSDPKKVLILISVYSQHFNKTDNPWPVVDLLISESSYFTPPELVARYLSVLAFLIKNYPEYRSGRSQHCWNQVCALLSSDDQDTIKYCYYCLCSFAESGVTGNLPTDLMLKHSKIEYLQEAVFTLFDICQIPERDVTKKLITTLLKCAETNVKATIVLIKLTERLTAAKAVMNSSWMLKQLPTVSDTLRLFLSILQHQEIREDVGDKPDFVGFMNFIISNKQPSYLSILCTILRRIPLSVELIQELSSSGFFEKFYAFDDNEDDSEIHSVYLLTDTISRYCFIKEFLPFCDVVTKAVCNEGDFSETAAMVSLRLAKFSKCWKRFAEKNLDVYYKKKKDDPKMSTIAKKFLGHIEFE